MPPPDTQHFRTVSQQYEESLAALENQEFDRVETICSSNLSDPYLPHMFRATFNLVLASVDVCANRSCIEEALLVISRMESMDHGTETAEEEDRSCQVVAKARKWAEALLEEADSYKQEVPTANGGS